MIIKVPHDIDFGALQIELSALREVVVFDVDNLDRPTTKIYAIEVITRLLRSIDNLKKIVPSSTIYQFLEVYARTNSGVRAIICYIQSMKYRDRKKSIIYSMISAEDVLAKYIEKKEE